MIFHDLVSVINQVIHPRSSFRQRAGFVSSELRYAESHEQQYAKEWVEYFGKFGTHHLSPRIQHEGLWIREDVDIKAIIGTIIFTIIFAVLFFLWTIVKFLFIQLFTLFKKISGK